MTEPLWLRARDIACEGFAPPLDQGYVALEGYQGYYNPPGQAFGRGLSLAIKIASRLLSGKGR